MATRLCDVCGRRPAAVTVRRIVPGGGARTEHLCEVHAAQARGGPRRSPFGGGGSLFDDFFDRFSETSEAPRRSPRRPRRSSARATRGRAGGYNAVL